MAPYFGIFRAISPGSSDDRYKLWDAEEEFESHALRHQNGFENFSTFDSAGPFGLSCAELCQPCRHFAPDFWIFLEGRFA